MNKLLIGCLASFSLLFLSCETEEAYLKKENNTFSKYITINDIKSDSQFLSTIDNFESIYGKSDSKSNKQGLILNTNKILLSQIDSIKCYTIPVHRFENKGEYIENLVLKVKSNGAYESFAIKYYLTYSEREKLKNGQTINFEGKYQIFSLDKKEIKNSSRGAGDPPVKCYEWVRVKILTTEQGAYEFSQWQLTEVDCDNETGGCASCSVDENYEYPETYNWDLTWNNQVNAPLSPEQVASSDPNYQNGINIATSPVFEFSNEDDNYQSSYFYSSLTNSQKAWSIINSNEYFQLINYQKNNEWSTEANDNALTTIHYLTKYPYQTETTFSYLTLNNYSNNSFTRLKQINTFLDTFFSQVVPNYNTQSYAKWALEYYLLTNPTISLAQFTTYFNNPNISTYLTQNNFSDQSKEFINQIINYCRLNPNTTWEQIKNWFFVAKSIEGSDGENDDDFWQNPSLIFPQQNLPTLANFKNAYPKNSTGSFEMGYADVYNLIGGTPKAMRDEVLNDNDPFNDHNYDNACALRTSRALNYSGVIIPNIPGKTFKGSDNKYYFLGASNLYNWMIKTFPPNNSNSIVLSQSQGGANGINFPSLLGTNQGIYILLPINQSNSGFGASGHAGIYTTPELTHYYFAATGGVKSITLWILN